jgi:thiol-disulfide isomerase/thioredoxin
MKKFLLALFFLLSLMQSFAQTDSTQPPYKRFPTFPPAKLLNIDSTTYFSKSDLPRKKPVMLMIFSPTCEHCQHETEEIIKNMDRFKNIHIVMATHLPYDSMMAFRQRYGLAQYKNITVVQDNKYFLPVFYMISNLPYMALYNKKGKLITTFEGSQKIETLLTAFEMNK